MWRNPHLKTDHPTVFCKGLLILSIAITHHLNLVTPGRATGNKNNMYQLLTREDFSATICIFVCGVIIDS